VGFLWWRMILLALIGAATVTGVRSGRGSGDETLNVPTLQNPFELRPAMMFGIFFVSLSIISMLASDIFGKTGLLVLSAITGVTDIDPFILSLVQRSSGVDHVQLSAIIVAAMSNTLMKGIYFGALAKQMRKEALLRYGAWALLHIPFIIF
jgi:uncharacterized membrane protein (DUF4010 family)